MNSVHAHQLANGLTILVYPTHHIPKVSIQLWYNVGSKHEKMGHHGIAHFLEHMTFRGTNCFSGADINTIVHQLGGYCNAFTSYDFTTYVFDLPKAYWHYSLPLLADCMNNCTFPVGSIDAERKTVLQELRMYHDDFTTTLVEQMTDGLYPSSNYHPIIGTPQELHNIKQDALFEFYRTYYVPSNATLVVVGAVTPDEVVAQAQQAFDAIPSGVAHTSLRPELPAVTHPTQRVLSRAVAQSSVVLAWPITGLAKKNDYLIELVCWIIGQGRGSRLYRRLVDQLHLVADLEICVHDLFEQGLFFVELQPFKQADIPLIVDTVNQELEALLVHGITDAEFSRARKQAQVQHMATFENNQKLASAIGQWYLATGDAQRIWHVLDDAARISKDDIIEFVAQYLRPECMHQGFIIPADANSVADFAQLESADQGDPENIALETPNAVPFTFEKKVEPFMYPRAHKAHLSNGLSLLWCHKADRPKLVLFLDFKASHYHDPEGLEGLSALVSNLVLEGTAEFPGASLTDAFESQGMSASIQPGGISISLLKEDLEQGLHLLDQLVCHATFDEQALERIRSRVLVDVDQYFDDPTAFVERIVKNAVYGNHPYHKTGLGTRQTINAITRDACIRYYQDYYSPRDARLIIVGDLQGIDVPLLAERALSTWHGPHVPDLYYPPLAPLQAQTLVHPITRDQVVLCIAGRSVSRFDPHFDALLVLDQIICGGQYDSMSSYLFELRESTGLFYAISGSLLDGVGEQPGIATVKTLVSPDHAHYAANQIIKTLEQAAARITTQDLEQAITMVESVLIDYFESTISIAQALVFLDRYKLPADYFDTRTLELSKLRLAPLKHIAQQLLNPAHLLRVFVGPVRKS